MNHPFTLAYCTTCGSPSGTCTGSTSTTVEKTGGAMSGIEYTLAEVRNGTGWPKGARFVLVSDEAQRVQEDATRGISFTREQVEAWAGRKLTGDQVQELEEVIPNSSVPDSISVIVNEAMGLYADEEGDS